MKHDEHGANMMNMALQLAAWQEEAPDAKAVHSAWLERMGHLWGLAHTAENIHVAGLSRFYISQLETLSATTGTEMASSVMQRCCPKCSSVYIAGANCTVRVRRQARKRKGHAEPMHNCAVVTCGVCGHIERQAGQSSAERAEMQQASAQFGPGALSAGLSLLGDRWWGGTCYPGPRMFWGARIFFSARDAQNNACSAFGNRTAGSYSARCCCCCCRCRCCLRVGKCSLFL